jgi:hypothetical protein
MEKIILDYASRNVQLAPLQKHILIFVCKYAIILYLNLLIHLHLFVLLSALKYQVFMEILIHQAIFLYAYHLAYLMAILHTT